jgi:L-threonylcarbamoyladenylate synthase
VPRGKVPEEVTAGEDTVAVRIPANNIARELIRSCGFPLAAPSANTSTRPSPTTALHVYDDLKDKLEIILDGGQCREGLESTVIDAINGTPTILRPGAITLEQIRKCKGFENTCVWQPTHHSESKPRSPGMKYTHYSPNCDLILFRYREELDSNSAKTHQRESLNNYLELNMNLKFGILRTGSKCISPSFGNAHEIHLGSSSHNVAFGLFKGMRDLESIGVNCILVEGIHSENEGLAVMNRLYKAASKII